MLYNGLNVKILRRDRKTVTLHILYDGNIEVSAPLRVTDEEILEILEKKKEWINQTFEKINNRKNVCKKLNDDEIEKLTEDAYSYFETKTRYYASLMNVDYGKITVRKQKSKWGSCSSNGNLSFNVALMLTDEKICDYVIIHELCHRKYMNHSEEFWKSVEKFCPDYQSSKAWLKENGFQLMSAIHE